MSVEKLTPEEMKIIQDGERIKIDASVWQKRSEAYQRLQVVRNFLRREALKIEEEMRKLEREHRDSGRHPE